ncbi:hypothetical protein C8Q79DRAFT_1000261 [Trametes meyenii]|nr:hypothetical protein C8Q79DRAFT_1000261 [Trametes meyenii]
MDPETPVNIAKGAAVTCEFVLQFAIVVYGVLTSIPAVAAGTFTALHSLYRGSRHPVPLALSAASNGGIAGAIFFGIREVVVSPLLRAALVPAEPDLPSSSSSTNFPPSWSQLRTHHLLDSAASGALTGAIINKWRNGRVLAGASTAAFICTLLQLGFNELGVARIKYISRKIHETQDAPAPLPAPEVAATPKVSIFDRFLGIIGFRKLSDDEYLKVLKKQRDEALERIAVLEKERSEQAPTHEEIVTPPETA